MTPNNSLVLTYNASTWTDTEGVWVRHLSSIHFNGSHGWAVGSGQILHSTDSGQSWENKVPSEIARGVSIPERVFTTDQHSVWVLLLAPDANNCYYSADAGRGWNVQKPASMVRPRDVFFVNKRTGWILSDDGRIPAGDAMIHITHNGGATWDSCELEIKGTARRVKFITSQKGLLIQHTTNPNRTRTICNILTTEDGGYSWKVVKSFNRYIADLCMVTEDCFVVVGEGGFISRSTDGGINWSRCPTKTRDTFNAVKFNSNGIGAAAGDFGLLMTSNDFGHNWTVQPNNCDGSFVDLTFPENNRLLIGATTGIYALSL